MPIQIQSDPEDHQRREIKRPPNYMSVGMRLRLGGLFAALILVLIMMKEARKPERWEWMGFDKTNPAVEANKETEKPKPIESTDQNTEQPQSKVQRLDDLISNQDTSAYPAAGQQFWTRWFNASTVDQQRGLIRLLRSVVNRTELALPDEDLITLIESVKSKRDEFARQLQEQIAALPNNTNSKEQLARESSEAASYWEEKVFPAWELTRTGEDITLSQQNANKNLMALLRKSALALVADGASLSRPEEGAAWLLCWEQALGQSLQAGTPVQRIQLMSQPVAFRGEVVSVQGWVRSARKLKVKRNELGIGHYFVLWLRPADTNVGPYCVFTQSVPSEFGELGSNLIEMNKRVSLNGVFFKIRTYEAASGEILTCPLLLAKSVEWLPVSAEIPVDSWTPPWWMIGSVLLLMPLVAGFFAWWVFSSTETRRFVHGPNTQKSIDNNLFELKKNREIKTDLERVQSLERAEIESGARSSTSSTDPEME